MANPFAPADQAVAERLAAALGERYRLTGVLGRGGFGVVFAAEEPALGRAVAIKVLRPEIAAPVLRERFRREATSAASLRHPNIIPIYDIGTQGDLCWCVMPRIQGETLRELLEREGRLPVAEARRILQETALALGVAHRAGLIHRDIKPDNILLEGPERRAVLTDFGIAKSLSAPAGERGLTTAGLIVGTPDYMSPEQAGGEPIIGPQSDIYSLGVMAYQLIAGQRPFPGTTPGAILLQQLKGPPAPLRRVRPECPEGLASAVHRCLALEPGERWDSAEALLGALGRWSVPAAPLPPSASANRPGEVEQFRRLLGGAAILCLVAALADAWRGGVLLLPLTALLGAAVVAARYGSLWTRGYGWSDLVGSRAPVRHPAGPAPAASQARADRAGILKALAALPRAERARLGPIAESLDGMIGELERLKEGEDTSEVRTSLTGRIARLRLALERRGHDEAGVVLAEVTSFLAHRPGARESSPQP